MIQEHIAVYQAYIATLIEYEKIIDKLVEEGERIGKVPWCCDGWIEGKAATRLLYGYGITERETMIETITRRAQHDEQWRQVLLRLEQEQEKAQS